MSQLFFSGWALQNTDDRFGYMVHKRWQRVRKDKMHAIILSFDFIFWPLHYLYLYIVE